MSFKDFRDLLEADGAPLQADKPRRPQIVVVDDDASIRTSLGIYLGERYDVALCASAQEGVEAVHENVCAVILDIKMGKYDGFWACDQIRQKYPEIPVIFYSAYQDAKDPFDIINHHRPFGYITKDADIRRLLDAIDTAVTLYTKVLAGSTLLKAHRKTLGL